MRKSNCQFLHCFDFAVVFVRFLFLYVILDNLVDNLEMLDIEDTKLLIFFALFEFLLEKPKERHQHFQMVQRQLINFIESNRQKPHQQRIVIIFGLFGLIILQIDSLKVRSIVYFDLLFKREKIIPNIDKIFVYFVNIVISVLYLVDEIGNYHYFLEERPEKNMGLQKDSVLVVVLA